MGLDASAYLVYGVLVRGYVDDNYTPHPLWDAEEGYWRELEDNDYIELHCFGHYDSSDDPQVIVRVKRTAKFSGDCWDPTPIPGEQLNSFPLNVFECTREAKRQGYDLDFAKNAKWWLVASYG